MVGNRLQNAVCFLLGRKHDSNIRCLNPSLHFCAASTNKPFGDYYPHTRWIDTERHTIQVDAFPHYLLITERGKRPIKIRGFWQGRTFLKDLKIQTVKARWDASAWHMKETTLVLPLIPV
jgi:hypothetical protein